MFPKCSKLPIHFKRLFINRAAVFFKGHHGIRKIRKFDLPPWILAFCLKMLQTWLPLLFSI